MVKFINVGAYRLAGFYHLLCLFLADNIYAKFSGFQDIGQAVLLSVFIFRPRIRGRNKHHHRRQFGNGIKKAVGGEISYPVSRNAGYPANGTRRYQSL